MVPLIHRVTGKPREVDIVVRDFVGEHPVVVSLECIEQSRPANVTWIETMKAKHDHLETNRLVLVSLSGFSDQALELSRFHGISTYTPEEACAQDWTQVVGQAFLLCVRHSYKPLSTSLRLQGSDGAFAIEAGPDTELFRPDTNATGKLRDLVMSVLRDQDFATVAMDSQMRDGAATIEFDFALHHDTYAIAPSGSRWLVLSVHVKAQALRTSGEVPLTSVSWNGVPAAFGAADTPLGPTVLTIVEPAPGQVTTKVIVDNETLPSHRHPDTNAGGARKVRFGAG
jgi:hypothetical protein